MLLENGQLIPGLLASEMTEEAISLGREYMRLMSYYSCAIMEIETKFKVLNTEFSTQYARNPIETIKTRLKKPKSILEKMIRIGKPFTVCDIERELNDVAGVRVICSFLDDIYHLADMIAKQDDIRVVRIKDYIKNPKESGYRSLHLIVEVPIFLSNEKRTMRVEIQLRTIAMDFWASLEHKLRYKKDISSIGASELAKQLEACAFTVHETDVQMLRIRNRIEREQGAEQPEELGAVIKRISEIATSDSLSKHTK